jgi:drug/metabolite transporter (DMT)-like permease
MMFAVLCFVWGSTWIAMKLGSAAVPPGVFVGLRWIVAGSILLAWVWLRHGRWVSPRPVFGRLAAVASLMILGNQIFTLHSLRYVGSGLGSVINCALTPLSLLGFALLMGQERMRTRIAVAMGLGVVGILLLFGPAAMAGRMDGGVLLGAFGILLGTLSYSWGSVLARPVMAAMPALQVAGIINLLGGLMCLAFSLAFEDGAWQALDLNWGWGSWVAWLWLVGPAALGASTMYLVLVRDWGVTKTGSYAFISPIVAVLLGLLISNEALHPVDAIGMALMLCGAAVALRRA